MKRCVTILVAVFICIFSGCSRVKETLGPKKEMVRYDEKTIAVGQPFNLRINTDSANIDIYSWNKEDVKFEIARKIRGSMPQAAMEKMLDDFRISVKQDTEDVFLSSMYSGRMKSPADIYMDLKVYMPKKVKLLECALDTGKLKIYDDLSCSLRIDVGTANVSINKFTGILRLDADMCDLKISNGDIKPGSSVNINMGNIWIRSRLESSPDYNFCTNIGNIELCIPSGTKACFDTMGMVESSDFPYYPGAAGIKIRSGMGRIDIKKY